MVSRFCFLGFCGFSQVCYSGIVHTKSDRQKEHITCTQSTTSAAQLTSRKCPKNKQSNTPNKSTTTPSQAFPESVKLVQSPEARTIMQNRLFAKDIYARHSDVYSMSMAELVNAVNEYCC